MTTKKQSRSPEAPDAAFLPGYGWEATTTTPPPWPGASTDVSPALWWVRTSPSQVVSPKSGQPLGFKHTLMNGNKAVCSAVGADGGRTLQAQAGFINSLEAVGGCAAPSSGTRAHAEQLRIHRPEQRGNGTRAQRGVERSERPVNTVRGAPAGLAAQAAR